MITITPDTLNIKCKYTLLEPVSHHDPVLGAGANVNLYRRQLVRLPYKQTGRALTSEWYPKIASAFPVPVECVDLFEDEPFERFIAIVLVKTFIENYSWNYDEGEWGQGLFTGVEAYSRLIQRIELASPRALNLKEFWAILVKSLNVTQLRDNTALFKLLSVPSGCHHAVLYHLGKYAAMLVEMARYWIDTEKCASDVYSAKAKKAQTSGEVTELAFLNDRSFSEDAGAIADFASSIPVPTHSGNDIRHDVRYAGMIHLFATLGLDLDTELPTGIKALFENGGNIAKGKSAPSTAYQLTQEIRANYPLLGLMGGCTDSFMLGDSNLQSVSAFWAGREFNNALEALFGVSVTHSVCDMLDNWTLHRHVGRYDGSPMPYSFETMVAGAELYVNFQLSPWTTDLEWGAFWAALQTYRDIDSSIGGQSAKGFGKVEVEYLSADLGKLHEARIAYQQFLTAQTDELAFGLKKGTLGTKQVVCS